MNILRPQRFWGQSGVQLKNLGDSDLITSGADLGFSAGVEALSSGCPLLPTTHEEGWISGTEWGIMGMPTKNLPVRLDTLYWVIYIYLGQGLWRLNPLR